MPDVHWNQKVWGQDYDWKDMGEEWSDAWGSSNTQWVATIYPRIYPFIPCGSILEIAPGFGRWTKFLLGNTDYYCGIDISEPCITKCNELFSTCKYADFYVNDGFSLDAAKKSKYDFVFSFDSLVHAEVGVLDGYISQILENLLNKNGVAFIHHSNMGDAIAKKIMTAQQDRHCRDVGVSHNIVATLVNKYGGKILLQEILTWGFSRLSDCFTLFCRADATIEPARTTLVTNNFFDSEIAYSWNILNNYNLRKPASPEVLSSKPHESTPLRTRLENLFTKISQQ